MFCKNCGKEVDQNTAVCPHCGIQLAQFNGSTSNEMCQMAIIGFVLSFLISIAGLICSVIAYRKCRDENLKGKGFAIAGIAISTASIVLVVIYIIVAIVLISCAAH